MTIEEVADYFGNLTNACNALKITRQNMTTWKKRGYIPHFLQYKIAELTQGALKPDAVDPKIHYMERRNNNGTPK